MMQDVGSLALFVPVALPADQDGQLQPGCSRAREESDRCQELSEKLIADVAFPPAVPVALCRWRS